MTYWSRDYVTISFLWIFELTNDICITYCDIYLPRSCLFSLFGHLIWIWISELPKKHLIYHRGLLTWKTYNNVTNDNTDNKTICHTSCGKVIVSICLHHTQNGKTPLDLGFELLQRYGPNAKDVYMLLVRHNTEIPSSNLVR